MGGITGHEDHGCVAAAFVDLGAATGDVAWFDRARVLLDDALARFRADDGGFLDTAHDAEVLVARPRDPSDNASPSGLSSVVHALVAYAAITGEHSYRTVAVEAVATSSLLAAQSPRFAGWSLAAAEAMLDGPRDDVPLLAGRVEVDGRPAAYVCRHHVCAAPVTSPDELRV